MQIYMDLVKNFAVVDDGDDDDDVIDVSQVDFVYRRGQ